MALRWLVLFAATALPSAAAAEGEWDYTATFYGWFPGVSTLVETPVGAVEAEVGFDEILETLDFAFLGAIEARKGKWSLIADLQYFDVGAAAETPVAAQFSEATIDSRMVLLGAYATYAMVDRPGLRFDVGAGLRYADATIDTQLVGQGATADRSFSSDASWVDGVIAARMNLQLDDRWRAIAFADVGGFGIGDSSDLTWQVAAGVGYRLSEKWSAIGGYRHLTIERNFHGSDISVDVSGPFLGFQSSF